MCTCTIHHCPKLRVHPAPEVHDLTVGCVNFWSYAPGNAYPFETFDASYKVGCTYIWPGAWFRGSCTRCVHQKDP